MKFFSSIETSPNFCLKVFGTVQKFVSWTKKSEAFRQLLCGVWQSGRPDVWNRILKARGDKSS